MASPFLRLMDPVQTVLAAAWVDGQCVARLAYSSPAPHSPPATINPSASALLCSARPSDAPLISRRNPAPASPFLRPHLASPPLRKVRSFHAPQHAHSPAASAAALALCGIRPNARRPGSPGRGSEDPRAPLSAGSLVDLAPRM